MRQVLRSELRRRPTVLDRVFTVYVYALLWLGVVVYVVLFGPVLWVAGMTFDRRRTWARGIARVLFPGLARHFCFVRGYRLEVDEAAVDWGKIGPCIVVANHGSMMDSVLLMALRRGVGDGRIWSKGWPFKVPLLGWVMRLSGHLFVEDFNILPDAQMCLGDGTSLLVFPESSRTRTGRVGRFRDGAFLLAARTGRPVVVVAIHGAYACFPAGQPWMFAPVLKVEVVGVLRVENVVRGHLGAKREAQRMIAGALGEEVKSVAADVAA